MLTRRQTGSGSFMRGGLRTVIPLDVEVPREADRGKKMDAQRWVDVGIPEAVS